MFSIRVVVVVGGAERSYRGKTMDDRGKEVHGKSTTVTLLPEEEPIILETLCPHASHATVASKIDDGDNRNREF